MIEDYSECLPDSGASIECHRSKIETPSVNLSKEAVAAAGFDVEAPIVSGLIGNLTGSLPRLFKCGVCDHGLYRSELQYNSHIKGFRHQKKLQGLCVLAQLKRRQKEGERLQLGEYNKPNAFVCELCSLSATSPQQLEIHLLGARHRKNIEKAALKDVAKSNANTDNLASKKKINYSPKAIFCDICNVYLSSPKQYEQHARGQKHKQKMCVSKQTKHSITSEAVDIVQESRHPESTLPHKYGCKLYMLNRNIQYDSHQIPY